jgi:hypothetical protein
VVILLLGRKTLPRPASEDFAPPLLGSVRFTPRWIPTVGNSGLPAPSPQPQPVPLLDSPDLRINLAESWMSQ